MLDEATPQMTEGGDGGAAEDTAVNTPADRTTVEPTSSAPEGQRPGIASLWAESAKEADESGSDDEGDGTPETPDAAAPATEGDTPADSDKAAAEGEGTDADKPAADADAEKPDADSGEDTAQLKADLDALLESYEDPAVLNAAIEKAGVEKVSELPAVKALIGRITQSVRDQTTAAIEKAQRDAAQLAEVTETGKQAKAKLVSALDKLATDIEAGEEDLAIPAADAIAEAFEEYAGSAVGEYHTKAWNVLSDAVYSLPEMGGAVPEGVKTQPPAFTEEQKNLLEAVKGAPPDVWLGAHLAVERDVLWAWAQQEAAASGAQTFENEKVVLQAAHAKEVKTLTKTHEEAIRAAREEARAEALAERANGKQPPRTPTGAKPRNTADEASLDDAIPAGASIAEIRRIVKAKTEAGVEV